MTDELQEAIVAHLKLRFTIPDRFEVEFNELIAEHIKNASQLNRVSMVSITKQFRKNLEKDDWPEIKYIFKAIFVLVLRDHKPHLVLEDEDNFLQQYPEFVECSIEERKLLLEFRNMMVVSLQLVDPRNHKGELMTLVGHLCGTVVVTGGGQTAATDRRVLIYERETGILPRKLPERRRKIDKVLLPWTVSANQYIPLPGKASRSNAASANNTSNAEAKTEVAPAEVFVLAKKGRFSLPDTKSLLKCADSFWNYHRSLMEANQDIPVQPVSVNSIADVQKFPSHDIFYTPAVTVNPNGTTNTAKLRSYFANLPKIEGVFAPVLEPGGRDNTTAATNKPGIRDTQESRRLAREVAGHPVRDYHRVSSRASSGRSVRGGRLFGRPPPLPIPIPWRGPVKKPVPAVERGGAEKVTSPVTTSGTAGSNGAHTSAESASGATADASEDSGPEPGSSCDVSVKSLSESADEGEAEGAEDAEGLDESKDDNMEVADDSEQQQQQQLPHNAEKHSNGHSNDALAAVDPVQVKEEPTVPEENGGEDEDEDSHSLA